MTDIAQRTENGEVDFGPELDEQREQYANESIRQGVTDMALGGAQTVAGAATGALRGMAAVGTTAIGVGVSASADTKGGNPLANMAVIVPETMSATDSVVNTAFDAMGYAPRKIGGALLEGHDKSRKINAAAHKKNEEEIISRQSAKYVEDIIAQKEAQRDELYRGLKIYNSKKK